jgi:hypothetical protein
MADLSGTTVPTVRELFHKQFESVQDRQDHLGRIECDLMEMEQMHEFMVESVLPRIAQPVVQFHDHIASIHSGFEPPICRYFDVA